MKVEEKTTEQFISELAKLHQRNAEWETLRVECKRSVCGVISDSVKSICILLCFILAVIMVSMMLFVVPCIAAEGQIAENPRIIVGGNYNYPPYEFLDSKGEPTGYNVELTRAIAETMGLNVEIKLGPWRKIREALESGEIDVIQGMFYSEECDKLLDFSPPHTIIHHAIFARRNSPSIKSVEELRGKDIIVMHSDIMHDYVLENGLSDSPVLMTTQADALRLLASGEHDYALVAKLPGLYWVRELKLSNIVTVGPPICHSEYCYAVIEGNATLLYHFSEGLAILKETGRYREIYDKWLGVLEPRGMSTRTFLIYTAIVLIPLLLLMIGSFLWSWSLKRQVARRTEELKESEERHRLLVETMNDGLKIQDENGLITYVNDKFCKMLGYQPDEFIGRLVTDFLDDNNKQILKNQMAERRKGEDKSYEIEWTGKSGNQIPTIMSPAAFFDADGNFKGSFAVITDITSRKQAEIALREERDRAQRYLDIAGVMFVALDSDGKITMMNKRGCDILKCGPKNCEVIGMDWFENFLPERIRKEVRGVFDKLMAGEVKSVEYYENPILTWNDKEKIIAWHNTLVKDEEGNIIGTLSSGEDITERKRAEEALKEYSEHLAEMVEERTKELRDAQERLVRRERLAVLGQLAGGVGHELRNPLGVLSNAVYYLKLVLERSEGMVLSNADEIIKEYLDIISFEVGNSEKIITDLLNFSRIQSVDREEIAVPDLVAQVLERQPPPDRVQVTTEIPSDLPAVFVDPKQIGQQVLVNLVSNAYQAMPEEGKLTISAQGEKNKVRISVSDTGSGISEENLQKIFEPLFTTKAKGIGLGLSVTKNLVEANGGTIEVESKEGVGSTFTVVLPTKGLSEKSPIRIKLRRSNALK